MKSIRSTILILLLVTASYCYLQLHLMRYELRDSLKNGSIKCITKQVDKQLEAEHKLEKEKKKSKKKSKKSDEDDDEDQEDNEEINDDQIQDQQNYREICYEKDISFSLPIYLNNEVNLISLDTTAPISWFKGTSCHLEASSKKCSTITTNVKQKIGKLLKKKQAPQHHPSSQYAMIEGSSELVKGIQQTGKSFKFATRDSSRLTNLLQLLMLGFYMKGERDTVELESTNFINATEISQNLNYLCDGAISLRFDSNSQNSFLKELIDYQKTSEKYLTIYIKDYEGIVTVGEVASKYAKNGFGGLQWIDIKDDESFGKLPVITDIIIENQGSHAFSEIREKQYPAVLSLSASYIGIPKQAMAEWLKKFNKKSNCAINEVTKYLECQSFKQKQQSKIITFEFSGKKISFKLSQLKLGKSGKKTLFNMKQTLHDTYAVLGQPFFQKYLVVFDYNGNKIAIGEKSDKDQKEFINVVSLVRFICFVFLFGCSFILCFLPIKRCIQAIKGKTSYGKGSQGKAGETRRLKQYSPIQQNPYDELSGQIKKALQSDEVH